MFLRQRLLLIFPVLCSSFPVSNQKIGKVSVNFSQRLMKYYSMSVHEGVEVQVYVFLTSALEGGEWSASVPSHLTPAKEPVILIGFAARWPQSRTERLAVGKGFPARDRTTLPGFSIPYPIRCSKWEQFSFFILQIWSFIPQPSQGILQFLQASRVYNNVLKLLYSRGISETYNISVKNEWRLRIRYKWTVHHQGHNTPPKPYNARRTLKKWYELKDGRCN